MFASTTITLADLRILSRKVLQSCPSLLQSIFVRLGILANAARLDRRARQMTPTPPRPEKSYLSAAVDSISPWTASRSSTPRPLGKNESAPKLQGQQGGENSFNYRHGLSLRKYPEDCPPANIRWFYAVDVRLFLFLHSTIDYPEITISLYL